MELVDAAGEEYKQVAQNMTRAAGSTTFHAGVKVAGWSVQGTVAALRALTASVRQAVDTWKTTGKIPLRDFGRTITGTHEVVGIDDRAVARELESTLKRYGVTFAIERGENNTRTFHVQGKDVQVVQHALSVASERVDERITRNRTRRSNTEKIDAGVAERQAKRQKTPSRTKDRTLATPTPLAGDTPEEHGRLGPTR